MPLPRSLTETWAKPLVITRGRNDQTAIAGLGHASQALVTRFKSTCFN
jgi:hypothetical protein